MYKISIEIDEPYRTTLRPEQLLTFENDIKALVAKYANSTGLINKYNITITDTKK